MSLFTMIREFVAMARVKAPTCEITPGVWSIRDANVNLYLVRCEGGWIAIDAGMKSLRVARTMRKVGLNPAQVRAVFITHTDRDHVGGLAAFPQASVYVGSGERPLLEGTQQRTMFHGRVKLHNSIAGACEYVEDEQVIETGGRRVQCLHVPGHTPGSMAYLVDDSLLFAGDCARLESGKTAPFLEWIGMDGPQSRRSLEALIARVQGKPLSHVFTGHHGWSDKPEEALQSQ